MFRSRSIFRLGIGLLGLAFVLVSVNSVSAAVIYATTVNNDLVKFDSSDPCTILSTVRVSGLETDEDILGIDFRPATGELYALGSSSRVYTIDVATGIATAVSAQPFSTPLDGTSFGFDFNPTVDRIRVVSDSGQNLRVNPITGAVANVDAALQFSTTDANFGAFAGVVGAAYTNPDNDPSTGTTLYDLSSALDILVSQIPPNNGTLNTIGSLNFNGNDLAGFDISSGNVAYAAIFESGKTRVKKRCGTTSLFTVDLLSGLPTRIGSIGTDQPIRGLAVLLSAGS